MANDKFEDYLYDTKNYYGQYHHHKEQMAWVASIIYFTSIVWLVQSRDDWWGGVPQPGHFPFGCSRNVVVGRLVCLLAT